MVFVKLLFIYVQSGSDKIEKHMKNTALNTNIFTYIYRKMMVGRWFLDHLYGLMKCQPSHLPGIQRGMLEDDWQINEVFGSSGAGFRAMTTPREGQLQKLLQAEEGQNGSGWPVTHRSCFFEKCGDV